MRPTGRREAKPHLVRHALQNPELQLRGARVRRGGSLAVGAPGQPRGALPPVSQRERRQSNHPPSAERLQEARPAVLEQPVETGAASGTAMTLGADSQRTKCICIMQGSN